ncbi:MAG TPA: SPOR domain-containing protein [Xanthobacteraceae bacterium]|nr:SPOR domain-containing protein [Xanthobacteraceae bacterium]
MSMADDSRLRSYRSHDPYRRAAEPAPPSEGAGARDPLAELARLLGQSDPFAELGRSNPRPREAQDAPTMAPADWRSAPARQPQFAVADSLRARAQPPSLDYPDSPVPESHPFDEPVYDEPQASVEQAAYYDTDEGAHYDAKQGAYYGEEPQASQAGHDPEYYADEAPLDPQDEAMYDDPPRARRGGNLTTVIALVGCAVFGTAGAYAFRSYYTSPGATQPPPVITADTSTPTKIVPAGDPQASRTVQDRVANAEREQVISKQEEPVTHKELANQAVPPNQAAPRAVLPAPVAPGQGASQPAAGAASRSDEPKKVRTLIIRPDGGDMSGKPVTSQAAAQAPVAQPPAASAPQTPAPAAAKAAPARNSGPISLDPQSEAPAAATRTRTATAPPVSARAAPDATETAGEGFMVQLSSQKSEAEAQSSFRSLQAKFPNELTGLQPIIRRADLGSKGVFYRTMVGPFASAHEAGQFCANYKAAGGQCVVPNN